MIIDCNKAAEKMLCAKRNQIIGMTPDYFSPLYQPDGILSSVGVKENVKQIFQNGKHRFEWQHQRLNGENYWVEVTVSIMNKFGKEVLFVAWREIGERKRIEADLMKAKEDADRASKAKSEFLSNMSHEIRTPLNGIIGLVQIIMDENMSSQQRYYMQKINDSSKSLLEILNDILDYSKIEAGYLDRSRLYTYKNSAC